MLAIAERRARPKAERFDRPLRLWDGRVFLDRFPLSLSPSGRSPQRKFLNALT